MKKLKKIVSILLTAIMVLAMCVPVMAATPTPTNITINGGGTGSTYVAYKLLNVTDGGTGKFSYTVNAKYSSVLQTETGKTDDAEIVAYIAGLSGSDVQDFADDVYKAITTAGMAGDETTTTNTFSGIEQGYYLIAETVTSEDTEYSLVMLDTAGNDDITVNTKEGLPSFEKKIKEKNDTTGYESGWQDGADYDLGDNVPFKLTGTVSAKYDSYDTYYYAFHDEMSAGLTFNPTSVEVRVDGTVVNSGYEVVTTGLSDDCTFEVRFANLKNIASVHANSTITVEYNARLNENSVIGSVGNPNQARLEYSNNPYGNGTGKTAWDKVIAFTYQLVVNKVDSDTNLLEGAGFTLSKWVNGAWAVVGDEITGVTTFNFQRVDAGKYKLEETTVPAGYNKAADLIFTVEATYDTDADDPKFGIGSSLVLKDEDNNIISKTTTESGDPELFTVDINAGSATTNVVNQAGTELPSTGGIGTTIFYVVGVTLMLGAGVLLVTKKRMNANH